MRFMIIVKSCDEFEAETTPAPDPQVMAEMVRYHEELAQAGVLLDGSGLQPSRKGWRVHHGADGGKRILDGPFAEAKELIAGYTLIQVRSREEALEWSRRFPNPAGKGKEAVVELRQLYEMDDFPPSQPLEDFKKIDTLMAKS
ncbi:YciI family protein [Hydrogenophaga sp. BPS33]|uniref:YciI family protein n=1 Tax=Hydrogenophaga sp. BPS33 TaxID=2651974 RepID=UPI00131F6CEC|nr:YciI family protein [Hydrogenophaga sp. BPS33]QHE84413.1 YciI family protein [Hydrogenophaga sp. BPS33]